LNFEQRKNDMKKIEAIIKPFRLEEVKRALTALGVEGITTIDVRVFGREKGETEIYRGSDYSNEFLPKLLVVVVVADTVAEDAVKAIVGGAKTGAIGDGKVFISTIDGALRIRTGEEGEKAL
jgi:nitrogen regulatory protein P-II 1